ncbi:MAG TPA: shikimate kinase [Ktedonobacteraceae bacterium]|nr:shikimate kinase [Ktedonobacteraceae bacterium]
MRIVLIGMKGCGKTTAGALLAQTLQISFIDADVEIEAMHQREKGETLSFRQIFQSYGETYFQALDTRTLQHIARAYEKTNFVFACGGRTPLQEENQEILSRLGTIIFLNIDGAVLLKRILAQGIPAFFPYPDNPERSFDVLLMQRVPVYQRLANLIIDIGAETAQEIVRTILMELRAYEQH